MLNYIIRRLLYSLPILAGSGGSTGHGHEDPHVPKGPGAPHSRMGWRRAVVLGVILGGERR